MRGVRRSPSAACSSSACVLHRSGRLTRAQPMQKVRMYPGVPRELTRPAFAAHRNPDKALGHAGTLKAADGIRTHDLLHGKQRQRKRRLTTQDDEPRLWTRVSGALGSRGRLAPGNGARTFGPQLGQAGTTSRWVNPCLLCGALSPRSRCARHGQPNRTGTTMRETSNGSDGTRTRGLRRDRPRRPRRRLTTDDDAGPLSEGPCAAA